MDCKWFSLRVKTGKENSVNKTTNTKCDRCWNYFKKTVTVEGNHLCNRCHNVLTNE